uniref:Translational initiation factor 1 n=1 Tax=Callianthemum alatavicum TaxID=2491185 RepID=A0A5P9RZX5_9MAGN|nr:translational initiation factor 1 [Callianthemum alatavicum]
MVCFGFVSIMKTLGYVSGRILRSFIQILPGDRVKIEVSRYDSTRGRIIDRLRNKDSND